MPLVHIQPVWDVAKPGLIVFLSLLGIMVAVHFFVPIQLLISQKGWTLPPGPQGAPIVGNLLQMRSFRRDPIRIAAYVRLAYHSSITTH